MTEKGHARGVEESAKNSRLFEDAAFDYISKKYSLDKKELKELLESAKKTRSETGLKKDISSQESQELTFPISILSTKKISSLEAIVKYLRENKRLSYKKIGLLLHRNSRTLAVTYSVAKRKYPSMFPPEIDAMIANSENEDTKNSITQNNRLPFTIFDNSLSILESICHYLSTQNNSYSEIARLLSKDPRTIWTVCKRAEKKLKSAEEKSEEKTAKESEEKSSHDIA